LEPYIGKKGSDVHFCPDYNRPKDIEYTEEHQRILARGTYSSYRERATVHQQNLSYTGELYRLEDYRVTTSHSRFDGSKKFKSWTPYIEYNGYKAQHSVGYTEKRFSYLPFVSDYIPRYYDGNWGGYAFNAGDAQAFYQEQSKVHDGIEFPMLYTDGHAKPKFFFPYLDVQDIGGDFNDEFTKFMILDLNQ
jgi:hypothetical protein